MSYRISNSEGCTNCVGEYADSKKKKKTCFRILVVRLRMRTCELAFLSLYPLYCMPPPLPSPLSPFPPSPPPPSPPPLPAVYGFFATPSDGKLLSNASIGEGSQNGLMVYFGLLKGLPPSIRKVQFKTDTPNQGQEQGEYCPLNVDLAFFFIYCSYGYFITHHKGSSKCTVSASWPYLTPQLMKFQVIMSASSNNLALEVNNTVRINPQLSSTGENEFVVPLSVSILDTNGTQHFNYLRNS